jgi:hypothetical protein
MTRARQWIAAHLSEAENKTRGILVDMEAQSLEDPQLMVARELFQRLGTLAVELFAIDPRPRAPDAVAADILTLTHLCHGRLAPIRPMLDEALRVAREPT